MCKAARSSPTKPENVTAEYNKQFSEALKTTGGDPIKAHAIVVKLPGMAQRLAPKRGI